MIYIRHKSTGQILSQFDNPTLSGANLEEQDLRDADFTGMVLCGTRFGCSDLRGACFADADLSGADFYSAELQQCDFSRATASAAHFTGAQCHEAQFMGADLSHAVLDNANFTQANLSGANLEDAKLTNAYLSGANLTGVRLLTTQFLLCTDLHQAVGLDSAEHPGLSSIDQFTFRKSMQHLPDSFLHGMGYAQGEIDIFRTNFGPPQYHSCFISHARTDGEFADQLRGSLLANNVACYHYAHDLQGGKFWRAQLSQEIKKHPKLILVCSSESLLRPNVIAEIYDAIERERETRTRKLFPLRLDDFILSDEILEIADDKLANGEWREDWVRYVRSFHIPDFSQWNSANTYRTEVDKLLRDLKQ